MQANIATLRERDQLLAPPAPQLLNRSQPIRRLSRELPCLPVARITSS
jgi:hypothetical protein